MSISPPSDIVLDVARAADPLRYREAAARLGASAAADAPAFQSALAAETPKSETTRVAAATPAPRATEARPAADKAHRDFEAMVLANLLQAAMPEDGAALFGEGTAGSVWKSMLVEQIANQMAKSGGIGIAEQLTRTSQLKLLDDKTAGTADKDATRALLIDQVQRGFIGQSAAEGAAKIKL